MQTYVFTTVFALYLNVFVLITQSFLKVAALKAFAPTHSETPFQLVQGTVLLVFAGLVLFALNQFHPENENHNSHFSVAASKW